MRSEFIHRAFWRRDCPSVLKNGDIRANRKLLNNLERINGAGIDAEIDKLWVAIKLNGKLVNRFCVKKGEVGVKNGDVGAVINGGVTRGEVTLKLVRPKGVPRPMTLILPRTGAGIVAAAGPIGI